MPKLWAVRLFSDILAYSYYSDNGNNMKIVGEINTTYSSNYKEQTRTIQGYFNSTVLYKDNSDNLGTHISNESYAVGTSQSHKRRYSKLKTKKETDKESQNPLLFITLKTTWVV